MSKIIEVQNLNKTYSVKNEKQTIFIDANFIVNEKESCGIIGKSGSGKSTLAKILIGIEKYNAGNITILGTNINELLKSKKTFYSNIQYIYQNSYETFDSLYSVGDIICEIMALHNIESSYKKRKEKVLNLLALYGFTNSEEIFNRKSIELSGGQLQRIALIRAMMVNPKILILDEPLGMMDVITRQEIIEMLKKIMNANNITLIYISHEIYSMKELCKKAYIIKNKSLIEYSLNN